MEFCSLYGMTQLMLPKVSYKIDIFKIFVFCYSKFVFFYKKVSFLTRFNRFFYASFCSTFSLLFQHIYYNKCTFILHKNPKPGYPQSLILYRMPVLLRIQTEIGGPLVSLLDWLSSRRFSKKNADYSSDFFKTYGVTDFISFYKLVCSFVHLLGRLIFRLREAGSVGLSLALNQKNFIASKSTGETKGSPLWVF